MKQKTPEIGAQARTQIAQTLPRAIEKAMLSYHDFMDNPDSEIAADFKNHHAACKAALAHIELLLKLAVLIDGLGDNVTEDFKNLLQNARMELEKGYDDQ